MKVHVTIHYPAKKMNPLLERELRTMGRKQARAKQVKALKRRTQRLLDYSVSDRRLGDFFNAIETVGSAHGITLKAKVE